MSGVSRITGFCGENAVFISAEPVEIPAVGIPDDSFDSIIEFLERGLYSIAEKASFKPRSRQRANARVDELPKPLIWALGLFDIRGSKESPRFRDDKALKGFK